MEWYYNPWKQGKKVNDAVRYAPMSTEIEDGIINIIMSANAPLRIGGIDYKQPDAVREIKNKTSIGLKIAKEVIVNAIKDFRKTAR